MAFLIVVPDRLAGELTANLLALDPGLDLRTPKQLGNPDEIEFALLWNQPRGLLARLPGLKAVTSMGAGVDAILKDPELPAELPVGRLAGPRLAANMAAYLAAVVINDWKKIPEFAEYQKKKIWNQWAPEAPPTIGLLGTGTMGGKAAEVFQALDFPVCGWSRSGRGPKGVKMYSNTDGLGEIAARVDILICLLPLTGDTRGILDSRLFSHMKVGATLVNVGRGEHLAEPDLLEALSRRRPGRAILDVFATEPLPSQHPFWSHPQIFMTPHCSSITLPREAAELALESYRRVQQGEPPLGLVQRDRGY